MSIISKKICLLGDFGVGKTSSIERFVENKFSDRYLSTVGVKISRKSINIDCQSEGEPKLRTRRAQTVSHKLQVNLLIWDVEGHTKFNAISPNYLKGASGSIIVADVTRSETLTGLQYHIELFEKVNPQGKMAIALNKVDLIDSERLNNLIESYRFKSQDREIVTAPTSAKTGINIDRLFERLTKEMLDIDCLES